MSTTDQQPPQASFTIGFPIQITPLDDNLGHIFWTPVDGTPQPQASKRVIKSVNRSFTTLVQDLGDPGSCHCFGVAEPALWRLAKRIVERKQHPSHQRMHKNPIMVKLFAGGDAWAFGAQVP